MLGMHFIFSRDDVEWDDEQERSARAQVALNGVVNFTEEQLDDFEKNAELHWNAFYGVHMNRFFKNRHWLFTEFPELTEDRTKVIFEVGCGVGNTMFPIVESCKGRAGFRIYGCDFSSLAIAILKQNALYDERTCTVFILDAAADGWNAPVVENSVDVAILIFVLSAIHPKKCLTVAKQLFRYVKPGGVVLFRDYGRFDLAQLRFKTGQCIGENFYARRDGTRVYFFEQDEVTNIFQSAGFTLIDNREDKRLQVNRGKQLKMYRVWIQAKFQKPE